MFLLSRVLLPSFATQVWLQDGIAEVEMEDESVSAASEDEEDQAQEPAVKTVSSRCDLPLQHSSVNLKAKHDT